MHKCDTKIKKNKNKNGGKTLPHAAMRMTNYQPIGQLQNPY